MAVGVSRGVALTPGLRASHPVLRAAAGAVSRPPRPRCPTVVTRGAQGFGAQGFGAPLAAGQSSFQARPFRRIGTIAVPPRAMTAAMGDLRLEGLPSAARRRARRDRPLRPQEARDRPGCLPERQLGQTPDRPADPDRGFRSDRRASCGAGRVISLSRRPPGTSLRCPAGQGISTDPRVPSASLRGTGSKCGSERARAGSCRSSNRLDPKSGAFTGGALKQRHAALMAENVLATRIHRGSNCATT